MRRGLSSFRTRGTLRIRAGAGASLLLQGNAAFHRETLTTSFISHGNDNSGQFRGRRACMCRHSAGKASNRAMLGFLGKLLETIVMLILAAPPSHMPVKFLLSCMPSLHPSIPPSVDPFDPKVCSTRRQTILAPAFPLSLSSRSPSYLLSPYFPSPLLLGSA